jgi:hypothetical protein
MHLTAYVDDTNSHFAYDNITQDQDIHHLLTHIANTWEKVLHNSGGKLINTKCTYYYLNRCTSPGYPQLSQDTPSNIKVHTTKDTITIKLIASHNTMSSIRTIPQHLSHAFYIQQLCHQYNSHRLKK